MSECVENSVSSPNSSRCLEMLTAVSGLAYRPCAAASLASHSLTSFSKPIVTRSSRGRYAFWSGWQPTHWTSYSYELLSLRRPRIFSTTRLMPSMTSTCFILASSSAVSLRSTLLRASRSSPEGGEKTGEGASKKVREKIWGRAGR